MGVDSEAKYVDQLSQSGTPRRPILVWLIFLWSTYTLIRALLYWTGVFTPLNGRSFSVPISLAAKVTRGSIEVLLFAAALELFRMRKVAVPLWFAASIARTMLAVYDVAAIIHRHSRASILVAAVYVALLAIIWLTTGYAYRLDARRMLRPGM